MRLTCDLQDFKSFLKIREFHVKFLTIKKIKKNRSVSHKNAATIAISNEESMFKIQCRGDLSRSPIVGTLD